MSAAPGVGAVSAPVRICMIAACPFPANHGTPGSIREMAEGLADAGHDVHVVTYHYGEDTPLAGVRVHRIAPLLRETAIVVGPTARRPLYDLQMIYTTLRIVRRYRPDVLHAHGYEAALIAAVPRLVFRVPVIYSAHNTMANELPSYGFIRPQWLAVRLAHALDAAVPKLADRCLPHSLNAARFLERMGLGERTDDVVNFGIDVAAMSDGDASGVREAYGLGSGPVLLYAGVLDVFQRLDLLLEATALVARRFHSLRLLIVTTLLQPEHVARVRHSAAQLGIADRVVITDPQPLEAVRDLLHAADIAVVPRPDAAGFPIKLLNYLAARRPTVLFASSASVGMVHGQTAMLASPDTSEALANTVAELLDDPELRQRIADGGFEFVRAHHDRRTVAGQVARAYDRVLRRQQGEAACRAYSS